MSGHPEIKLFTRLTKVLLVFLALSVGVALYRLVFGIGAATNLNDLWPWGFWISVDVLGGVAMAAGGFIIACAVYILNWKKYKVIVRPAILNAFFGYLLAATSISLDIGRTFRIWHPMVMWQVNSIMFIVAIHVFLYTSTLATESSPMFFEKFGMKRAYKAVTRVMVPVVLFGVLLSTLHQSSLGAVYLIAAGKLSPLWYSKYLPYMFLISAILMGLNMVSFETIISARAFKHKPPMEVLAGLQRGTLIVGTLYFVLKLLDLQRGPGIAAGFSGSFTGNLWLLEMIVGLILPLSLASMKKVRTSMNRIFVVNVLVILGVLLNRLNVGIFGVAEYASRAGGDYFPSIMEFLLTAGMVAFAVLGFKVCAKYLNLFPQPGIEEVH
jgi:Ni/Fe-hydrogenase subunit HybB-like protein